MSASYQIPILKTAIRARMQVHGCEFTSRFRESHEHFDRTLNLLFLGPTRGDARRRKGGCRCRVNLDGSGSRDSGGFDLENLDPSSGEIVVRAKLHLRRKLRRFETRGCSFARNSGHVLSVPLRLSSKFTNRLYRERHEFGVTLKRVIRCLIPFRRNHLFEGDGCSVR